MPPAVLFTRELETSGRPPPTREVGHTQDGRGRRRISRRLKGPKTETKLRSINETTEKYRRSATRSNSPKCTASRPLARSPPRANVHNFGEGKRYLFGKYFCGGVPNDKQLLQRRPRPRWASFIKAIGLTDHQPSARQTGPPTQRKESEGGEGRAGARANPLTIVVRRRVCTFLPRSFPHFSIISQE